MTAIGHRKAQDARGSTIGTRPYPEAPDCATGKCEPPTANRIAADKAKARYWTRKLSGRCVKCNAGLQEDDGIKCVECAERSAGYAPSDASAEHRRQREAQRSRDKYRANLDASRAYARARREDKKIRGECKDCKQPCEEGSNLCARHHEAEKARIREFMRAKREGRPAVRFALERLPRPKRQSAPAAPDPEVVQLPNAAKYPHLTREAVTAAIARFDAVETFDLAEALGIGSDVRSLEYQALTSVVSRLKRDGVIATNGCKPAGYYVPKAGRRAA